MISRWTQILNIGYPTSNYMRRFIRSLPSKWRPMVTTSMWQRKSQKILRKSRRRRTAPDLQEEEQAANSLMGRIGTESEAKPLSEDKFIKRGILHIHYF